MIEFNGDLNVTLAARCTCGRCTQLQFLCIQKHN